jgi:Domain of unknown function (DUF1772)
MIVMLARFSALCFIGLVAGATLCVVLVERGLGSSGAFYVEFKQLLIRRLTVPLPLLAAIGVLAALVDTYSLWRIGPSRELAISIAAIILASVGGVLTKAGLFPINASMMTWDPAAPPPEWMAVQAKWAALHLARTAATILAFALLIVVNLLRSGSAR